MVLCWEDMQAQWWPSPRPYAGVILCIYCVCKIQVNIISIGLKQFSRSQIRVKQGGKRKNNGGEFGKDGYLYQSPRYICIWVLPVVAWEKGAGMFSGHLCLFPNLGFCSISIKVSHMESQVVILPWLHFFACIALQLHNTVWKLLKEKEKKKDRSLNHFYSIVRINASAIRKAYQEQHFEFTVLGFRWTEKAFFLLGLQNCSTFTFY